MIRRIIPCLDVRDGRVVKGKKFMDITDVDDPENLADYYSKAGADELCFYDISASNESRTISKEFVDKVAEKTSIPFMVGGGISSLEDIENIFERGASKASINSAAIRNPDFIRQASQAFGPGKIVIAMDVKKVGDNKWNVFTGGGRKDSGMDAIEWAIRCEELGAGELVINSIDSDGMKDGYDIELLKTIKDKLGIPIIASGGAGKMEDFLQAIVEADVEGVLAASVFHYKEIDIKDLKTFLKNKGIGVTL